MRDTVRNRRRLGPLAKLSIPGRVLPENDVRRTFQFGTYYLASTLAHRAVERAERIREKSGVPGLNSREANREIWNGARSDAAVLELGFERIERVSGWIDDGVAHEVGQKGDAVTVLRKPLPRQDPPSR